MIHVFSKGGAVGHYDYPDYTSYGERTLIEELIRLSTSPNARSPTGPAAAPRASQIFPLRRALRWLSPIRTPLLRTQRPRRTTVKLSVRAEVQYLRPCPPLCRPPRAQAEAHVRRWPGGSDLSAEPALDGVSRFAPSPIRENNLPPREARSARRLQFPGIEKYGVSGGLLCRPPERGKIVRRAGFYPPSPLK